MVQVAWAAVGLLAVAVFGMMGRFFYLGVKIDGRAEHQRPHRLVGFPVGCADPWLVRPASSPHPTPHDLASKPPSE